MSSSSHHSIVCGRNATDKKVYPVSVDDSGTQKTLMIGANDINGGTPHRHLTVDGNGRLLTYPYVHPNSWTNTHLLSIKNTLHAGVVGVHTFHTAETIVGAGTLSSGVFTNTRVVGKDKLGLCVSASLNHFTVVVYVSNDNTNWIALSTHPAETNGVHQALTNAFKYYKLIITNNDPTTSVVINVADVSH
jgi:hypothetical protein